MKSYSQVGQDIWAIEMHKFKKNGYFLDIGAFDGVNFSNSYLLESEYDWNGICIEALPVNFELLKNSRKCISLNCALTDKIGKCHINSSGSTSRLGNQNHNTVEVTTTTFEEIFSLYNVPTIIDYLSLDIEGQEYLALTKFPFSTHKCLVITVEHNLYCEGPTRKNQLKEILTANDYILVKEDVADQNLPFEDWYAHKTFFN